MLCIFKNKIEDLYIILTFLFNWLQEYGGNLNEAINAHFLEGDRHMYGKVVYSFSFVLFHLNAFLGKKNDILTYIFDHF